MDTPVTAIGIREAMALLKKQGYRLKRERYSKTPLIDYIRQIENVPLRAGLTLLYREHPFFEEAPAGARHHHWWKGGLEQHCCEMLGLGCDLMALYPDDTTGFTRDDLITAVFLHDFSKVFTYRYITEEERAAHPDRFRPGQVFIRDSWPLELLDAEGLTAVALMQYAVPVTRQQWSAVLFAEGGFSAAHVGALGQPTLTGDRVGHANPLATFVSMLDAYSANLLGRELR